MNLYKQGGRRGDHLMYVNNLKKTTPKISLEISFWLQRAVIMFEISKLEFYHNKLKGKQRAIQLIVKMLTD